ncbi:MAG TPA: hypothetical protein VGL13_01685, partial [Polyangiaceae bacterium]
MKKGAWLALAIALAPASAAAQGLGQIQFPVSCGDAARSYFTRGMLELHSFGYDQARVEFQSATRAEPTCAMGYWGEAMSHDETLWARQDTADGRALLAKAMALRARISAKEAAFIEAAWALFGAQNDGSPRAVRIRAYADALRRMHERWPNDDEIATLYALSLLSAVNPRATVRDRMEAGSIVLGVIAHNPQHPGALHYAIHAFDDVDHAILALPAARAYAGIAADAPHARHMPAHIFVELGQWADASAACESAWQVSLRPLAQGQRDVDLHSLSWLGPLYTEQGQRARADLALSIFGQSVAVEGHAAIPYILAVTAVVRDTDRWDQMDALLLPVVAGMPAMEARYQKSKSAETPPIPIEARAQMSAARAMAAARRHELDGAKKHQADMKHAHDEMTALASHFVDANFKVDNQLDELQVEAEIATAEGRIAAAESALRQAVPLEDSQAQTEGAEPWRISSYERLAELALAAGRNQEAAEDFAHAIERV